MRAPPKARAMLLAALLLAGLSACSEKPQRMVQEGQDAYNGEVGNVLAERARHQSESERIGG